MLAQVGQAFDQFVERRRGHGWVSFLAGEAAWYGKLAALFKNLLRTVVVPMVSGYAPEKCGSVRGLCAELM
ncbi:MAG: hypothetical protein AMXMBFR6_06330 [Betaproteobacteria bacterium]